MSFESGLTHALLTGSHTALSPYAQKRYFENHKVMSAIDKLHKLYSSTFEPLVWARSVGLEVINELDVLKAAIMAVAGGSKSETFGATGGWQSAAKGMETLNRGVGAAQVVGEMIGNGLQGLLKGRGLKQ
jgi:ubiquinone biosynthesis monooxygenase Coq6